MNQSIFYGRPYQQSYYPYAIQRQPFPFRQSPVAIQFQPQPQQRQVQNFQQSMIAPYQSFVRQAQVPSVMLSPPKKVFLSPQPKVPLQASKAVQPQIKQPKIDLNDELQRKYQEAVEESNEILNRYKENMENIQTNIPNVQQKQGDQQQPELEGMKYLILIIFKELALQYEDGFIYRGQGYQPSTRQGYGVLTDPQERVVYEGDWNENKYHGQGKLINYDNDENDHDERDWKDLSQIGNSWNYYEGQFIDGNMHGQGVLIFKNGEIFQGEFQEGAINGEGVFKTNNQYQITGIWENGLIKNFKKINL